MKSLAPAGSAARRGQGGVAAVPVELEHEVGPRRRLEHVEGGLVVGARGTAREGLPAEHAARADVHHGLEDRAHLVAEQELLDRAAVLELELHALDAHALPGLFHEPGHEALGHDQGVVEDDGEAHRDPPPAADVGRRHAGEALVQVLLDALGRLGQVGHPGAAFAVAALRATGTPGTRRRPCRSGPGCPWPGPRCPGARARARWPWRGPSRRPSSRSRARPGPAPTRR